MAKSKGPSPTQRSLSLLRKNGCIAGVVEQWLRIPGKFPIKRDLFHFADLIAANPLSRSICLVQTTSRANHAARRTKVLSSEEARIWLQSGGEIEIHSWAKQGKRGARKTWACSVERILASHFEAVDGIEEEIAAELALS